MDNTMIGIVYTGETAEEILDEIKIINAVKHLPIFKIFVKNELKEELCDKFKSPFDCLPWYVCNTLFGIEMTSIEEQYEKRKRTKDVVYTKAQIADKLGINAENLIIKE